MNVIDLKDRREPGHVPPPAPRPGWRRRIVGLLREPLLHFIIVGAVIFAAVVGWRREHDQHRIVVTPERVADLSTRYRMQFGAPPNRAQLDGLIDAYVEEEVLYREGVAQHLDRDDEIVRRRVAQKAQFLQQEQAPAAPTEAQLRDFYSTHGATYASPRRYSFTHLYFSTEQGGDAQAIARAKAALAQLATGLPPDRISADAFPDLNTYAEVSETEVRRIFGASPLVDALSGAPMGRWAGPFRSTYGWHLVRVDGSRPARLAPYAEVRERVRADYLDDAHEQAGARALAAARARYTIVRSDRSGAPR